MKGLIYKFQKPNNPEEWDVYHDIRQKILFENREDFSYDRNHPDEHLSNNYPFILYFGDKPVGVIRIDLKDNFAILRRTAVVESEQGKGYGTKLINQSEKFIKEHKIKRVIVYASNNAVGFYEKCGYLVSKKQDDDKHIKMYKKL